MANDNNSENVLKPVDLRGILHYVPMFRGQIFVIAIDGSIVAHDNFSQVMTDIAVLRSLNINLILIHGIGHQLSRLAAKRRKTLSDEKGAGPVDDPTLELAQEAAATVSGQLFNALTGVGVKAACVNAVRAIAKGTVKGSNLHNAGKLETCDTSLLHTLLKEEVVPLFGPVQPDRNGLPLRLNSDELAADLAMQTGASKLIFLTDHNGLEIQDEPTVNLPLEALEDIIQKKPEHLQPELLSKARQCARALVNGTARAHILDGRVHAGLLTEIFDKVGLGTMIHANAYQMVRAARKKDVSTIFSILKAGSRTEALRYRTRQSIETNIAEFYVYEIDGSIVACVSLSPLGRGKSVELASVLVQPFYQGKGVGKTMAHYAIEAARAQGYTKLVALTTQTGDFFQRCGFTEGTPKDLSADRRADLEKSGRKSRVFIKRLK